MRATRNRSLIMTFSLSVMELLVSVRSFKYWKYFAAVFLQYRSMLFLRYIML